MSELAEHEERAIRSYVNSQSPPNDQAELVQRVRSRRILGRVHEVFDVHCQESRWWVITDPTNLYSHEHFPDAEQALLFHSGLGAVLAEREREAIKDRVNAGLARARAAGVRFGRRPKIFDRARMTELLKTNSVRETARILKVSKSVISRARQASENGGSPA